MAKPRTMLSKDARREIRALIDVVLQNSSNEWPNPLTSHPFTMFSGHGFSVVLVDEEAELHARCVSLITPRRPRPGALSLGATRSLLNDAVIDVLKDVAENDARVDASVQKALQRLDARLQEPPRKFDVCVPVAGLTFSEGTKGIVKIGRVRFLTATRLLQNRRMVPTGDGPLDVRTQIQRNPDFAWAVATVEAVDSGAAISRARYQVQLAIDVINLYATSLGAPRDAVAYMPGTRALRYTTTLIRARDGKAFRSHSHETVGPFSIELRALHRFHGYRNVIPLIAPDPVLNAAQERMLSALRWISRGLTSPWNEEAFVDFVIALESLILGTKRDQELKYRLRARCVHLLKVKRSSRRSVADRVGKLYDERSAVVHRGSLQVSAESRTEARYFSMMAIFATMFSREFSRLNTEADIEIWFEDRVLGQRR